jgi:hypothetical protein
MTARNDPPWRAAIEEDIYEEVLIGLAHLGDGEEIDLRWLMPRPERVPADVETRMTMGELRLRIQSLRAGL